MTLWLFVLIALLLVFAGVCGWKLWRRYRYQRHADALTRELYAAREEFAKQRAERQRMLDQLLVERVFDSDDDVPSPPDPNVIVWPDRWTERRH